MKKTVTRKKPTANPASRALEDARRDRALLRRLELAQRSIRDLGRRIIAGRERMASSSLQVARRLCEGTEYDVFGVREVDALKAQRDEAIKQFDHVVAELQELKAPSASARA